MHALLVLIALSFAGAARAAEDAGAREAIAGAVREEMRATGAIEVTLLTCEPCDAAVDEARPEPGGRLGRPVRFRLFAKGRQIGAAIARVDATTKHLRVRTGVPAGEPLEAGALEVVEQQVPGALIEPLPLLDEIEGAFAIRDLAPGEIVTHRAARVPFAVRSGDAVVVRVVAGAVEARGTAKAQQSGRLGDVIRVVNPDSGRALRGRIVGRGEVEVIHGS